MSNLSTPTTELSHPIAFVLSGGGSLGAIQVGMLEALAEQEIIPDIVAGTSVGAINGAMVAMDPRGAAHRLAHAWLEFDSRRVFPHGLLRNAHALRTHPTHVYAGGGLAAILADSVPEDMTFEALRVPLNVVTTDVATGDAVTLTQGPILPALLASSAIPGVFPAVRIEGRLLYDGGLVANVPVLQAAAGGARSIVILDCLFPGHAPIRPASLADAMFFAATVVARQQTAAAIASLPADIAVLSLPGPDPIAVSPLNFSHTLQFIDRAYDAARAFLERRIGAPSLMARPAGAPAALVSRAS
ncbi:MAG: patatin-like phospholipase family protein [Candidatus Dormiibacterota bacterium]